MNSMDLIKSLNYLDDEILSDAANDLPEKGKARGGGIKNPKPDRPPRGGVKVKALIISICAIVAAVAVVLVVLFTTGVFDSKQAPIYKGMTISSAESSSASSSATLASASMSYGGDYKGKNDGIDKDHPFGGSTLQQTYESTLTVTGSGESIYYANAGDYIYITLTFDNPDYYDIVSFVLNDGTTDYHFSSYNFTEDSDYENISVKINVGTTPGIINYTISEIKYIDDEVNKDVIIDGDTVVTCGVRASNMVTSSVSSEAATLTAISFTATVSDRYSLIEYSGGYIAAILYDGETILQTKELSLGSNKVEFTDLSPNTLYQYAVVAYYDDLSGTGAAVNYLYTNSVYTAAVVLFDSIEVGQETISFGYSWYTGYTNSSITSLVLACEDEETTLTSTALSASGLYTNTDYTLTAYYVGVNNTTESITLTFTTHAKEVPTVAIKVTDTDIYSLSYEVTYTDTDDVGQITAIGLYNGSTLVESVTDLTERQFTFTNLSHYTQYTLVVSYSYDLNDRNGIIETEESLSEYTDPLVEVNSVEVINSSGAVSEGDTVYLRLKTTNYDDVTYSSVVINGTTYNVSVLSSGSNIILEIVYDGLLYGGDTVLTVEYINNTIDGRTYSTAVSANNTTEVFFNGALTVEDVSFARINSSSEFEQTYYGFASEQIYVQLSLSNTTKYDITSITVSNNAGTMEAGDIIMSDDYQTVYIPLTEDFRYAGWHEYSVNSISYSNESISKTKTVDTTVYFMWLDDEVVEIYTADQLSDVDDYKYYKLMTDLDLSGYTWANMGNSMNGVFDGNGYTISNITAVETYNDRNLYLGLFAEANGIIANLTIEDMLYIVTLNNTTGNSYNMYVGGVVANANRVVITDVNVVNMAAKVLNAGKTDTVYMGGLAGYIDNFAKTENVEVEAVLACEVGQTGSINVGGLYGCIQSYTGNSFKGNKINSVTVDLTANLISTGSGMTVGGLIGGVTTYNGITISNATVNSTIIADCTASDVSITIGGVVGSESDSDGYISYYDVTSDMTANVTHGSNNAILYIDVFVNNNGGNYIDDSCTGTATVTDNSSVTYYYLINGFEFSYTGGEYYLTGYSGSETDIIMPDDINGSQYTIARYAFAYNYDLKSITATGGVKAISDYAFAFCSAELIWADSFSVTGISSYAFRDYKGTNLNMPEGVTTISGWAFADMTVLVSVTIPNSVTEMGWYTFQNCTSLTTVIIGTGVTFGDYEFDNCTSLTTIYYCGTAEQWANAYTGGYGNEYLAAATVYFYSEEQPTQSGNYWHYVDGVATAW